ncbi:hypothetical protein T484DRAFT_2021156 [Baffinella frigidus]|nr:hypothetical protein T484DRAFT_2021156 [Cryptophyta sp. CCMP2293]
MVGRLVGQNRMASCASSMLATLLLISGMVYHVAGAGQIAFSHLPPGSLGKVRSSPVRSSLEGRRSPPIRGRKMAEDFSMAERGAGATTSVGGAHFWAETAGGTSAPPGELPASVEMPPALDAALEGGTAMGFTRREVVASKHAAPAWDKFDAAVPRPLSAFLATPSGMVDHFFKASSKTVARPSGRSKTLSRVGPDSDEETHFLSATIKDSAEGVSTGTLDTSEKAEPHVALQPGAPPPPAVHFSAAASGEVILGGAAPPVGVKVPAALEAALASGQMETLRAVEEDGGETHFAAGADGAGGRVTRGQPGEAKLPESLEMLLESESVSLDAPGAAKTSHFLGGGGAAPRGAPRGARMPKVLRDMVQRGPGVEAHHLVVPVAWERKATCPEGLLPAPRVPPALEAMVEALAKASLVARRSAKAAASTASVTRTLEAAKAREERRAAEVERVTLEKAFLLLSAAYPVAMERYMRSLVQGPSTQMRMAVRETLDAQVPGALSAYLLSLEGYLSVEGVVPPIVTPGKPAPGGIKVPAALKAMLYAGRVEPPFVAQEGGGGSDVLPGETMVPEALLALLESDSVSLNKPGSRAVAKVPAALGAMLDVAAASEDVGTVSQGLPEEATTPVALETMLESDSISLDKPGALESVSAPKSSVGGQAAGKVSREERPDPPAAARVPRVLQNILDAQAGMIVRPPVQAVVHHFLASTVEAVERGPALPPWAARVPEVLGVLLTPGDEVVVSRREEERRRVKAGVSMHFVAGALGQAGGVGSSAAPWQASVPDALEGLLESDSTSLERPWGSSVWLTQGGGAGDDGAQGSPDAQTLSVDSGSPSVTLDARASAEVEILARIIVEEKLAAAQDLVARQDSATREGEPVLAAEEEPVAARAGSVEARAGWEAAKKQARDAVEEAGQAGYLEGFVDVLAIKGAERRAARLAQLGKVGVEEAAVVAGNDDDDDEKELFSDRDWEKVDSELVETEAEEAPKEPAGQLAMFGGKESPVVVLWKAVAAFFSGFSNSGRK